MLRISKSNGASLRQLMIAAMTARNLKPLTQRLHSKRTTELSITHSSRGDYGAGLDVGEA
jgi:hypothetical protein